ncbi:unnamed protein product [Vitrella brassicaformis CCMP3155]|uniref:Uncharacterized protein n=1 Tax=Vitrella brassicaformis (strain CCMP3155) TaxID=1169540 RepID=A0A0G4FVW1_VITBC|nr:unnamed protein product [Vitrella brassicaformis CCMP3155]|eukprot:CEM19320.1 unnamed protein product [Vitrella brassicaformis CCMP3155]
MSGLYHLDEPLEALKIRATLLRKTDGGDLPLAASHPSLPPTNGGGQPGGEKAAGGEQYEGAAEVHVAEFRWQEKVLSPAAPSSAYAATTTSQQHAAAGKVLFTYVDRDIVGQHEGAVRALAAFVLQPITTSAKAKVPDIAFEEVGLRSRSQPQKSRLRDGHKESMLIMGSIKEDNGDAHEVLLCQLAAHRLEAGGAGGLGDSPRGVAPSALGGATQKRTTLLEVTPRFPSTESGKSATFSLPGGQGHQYEVRIEVFVEGGDAITIEGFIDAQKNRRRLEEQALALYENLAGPGFAPLRIAAPPSVLAADMEPFWSSEGATLGPFGSAPSLSVGAPRGIQCVWSVFGQLLRYDADGVLKQEATTKSEALWGSSPASSHTFDDASTAVTVTDWPTSYLNDEMSEFPPEWYRVRGPPGTPSPWSLLFGRSYSVAIEGILPPNDGWRAEIGGTDDESQDIAPDDIDPLFIYRSTTAQCFAPPGYPIYTFGHPIEMHFAALEKSADREETPLSPPPRLFFLVYSKDGFGKCGIEGYGYVDVPLEPGQHEVECSIWKPIQQQAQERLLGSRTPLFYPKLAAYTDNNGTPRNRSAMLTSSQRGVLQMQLSVIKRQRRGAVARGRRVGGTAAVSRSLSPERPGRERDEGNTISVSQSMPRLPPL